MSVKRSIEFVDSPEISISKKDFPIIIEPKVNLEGPDNLDQRARRRARHDQTSRTRSPSTANQSFHDVEDQSYKLPPISPLHGDTKDLCFGMIHNANAVVVEGRSIDSLVVDERTNTFKSSDLQLSFKDHAVFISTSSNQEIAVLNKQTGKLLKNLSTLESCRMRVYPASEKWKELAWKASKTGKDDFLLVEIVIYGSKMIQQSVDRMTSAAKIWLQAPDHQEVDSVYDNPHELNIDILLHNLGLQQSVISQIPKPVNDSEDSDISEEDQGLDERETKKTRLQMKIAKVLHSLTRPKSLRKIEADISIKAKLLDHQKTALDFMEQRELGPIPWEYSLWAKYEKHGQVCYQHTITKSWMSSPPNETLGGILADDMGLGKTLTVLATIIRTRQAAKNFVETNKQSNEVGTGLSPESGNIPHRLFSRATLVIAPSSLLINGWKKEIEEHCAGSMSVHIYHGKSREVFSEALTDWDIVITTYHTLVAEALDLENPIKQITWFRIVLDEAHIIRNMKTKLFKEVAKLPAKFRWCLTGTPVQNGLEDLAALIAFLRLSPLNTLPEFRKHIIIPLTNDKEDGLIGLRNLLDSVCLRRTKKLLDLPEIIIEDRRINFSSEERIIYNKLIAAVKDQESHAKNSTDYLRIFSLQLQLRRICNHGTFQNLLSEIAVDNEFDPEQAFDLLRRKRQKKCTLCKMAITDLSDNSTEGGQFTSCGHLICLGCIPGYEASLEKVRDGLKCAICERTVQNKCSAEGKDTCHDRDFKTWACLSSDFGKHATSSKISALTHDIITKDSEGKSIVFSCWTRSLDLVAHFLMEKRIKFLRIDGTYSHPQRQKILDDYCLNDNVQILLMTTGTGAVGLNLTIANRVYMLEPQWNPMIESQAIARVERLGQQKIVKVLRYTVISTIEENLRNVQKRKLGLATIGWRQGGD